MARPRKVGLQYFPMDCRTNSKLAALEAEHGLAGWAIYVKLLQEIYQTELGELDLSVPFVLKTFARANGTTVEFVGSVIDTAFTIGLFDREAWTLQNVLTSDGIKSRISAVSGRREKDRIYHQNGAFSSFRTENPPKTPEKEREINTKEIYKEREVDMEKDGTQKTYAERLRDRQIAAGLQTGPTKNMEELNRQAEIVYNAYPRHVAKVNGIKAIKKALTKKSFDDLLTATKKYAEARRGEDHQFTPHPASWFNQERYEEDPTTWKSRVKIGTPKFREDEYGLVPHSELMKRTHDDRTYMDRCEFYKRITDGLVMGRLTDADNIEVPDDYAERLEL